MELIGTIILFLCVLSILVLIHEWGHFTAARIFGVRVEEFGLGFPPKAKTLFTDSKGTAYTLNWLPLGGFVRLKGEQGELASDSDSFASKPVWQKLIILAAGVFMNLVLAIFVFTIGFTIGMPQVLDDVSGGTIKSQNIQITHIMKDSPASASALKEGDIIDSVNGEKFQVIGGVQQFMKSHENQEVTLRVKRGSEFIEKKITPEALKGHAQVGVGVELIQTGIVSYPIHKAFVMGLRATGFIIVMIFSALWNALFHFAFESFVGPVGIAAYTATVSKLGFSYLLNLIAQLSISLAVVNFLPIPALDGGRALFVFIEKIRGKSLKSSLENTIHFVGFALLILLLVLITWRDIHRLIAS